MSEIPMYPDECPHGASRPDLCGHCQLASAKAETKRLRSALEWYADYGAGAAKEPKPLPSQGVALGMLHYDGGKRARTALGRE